MLHLSIPATLLLRLTVGCSRRIRPHRHSLPLTAQTMQKDFISVARISQCLGTEMDAFMAASITIAACSSG